MKIGIDCRVLMDKQYSGVAAYTNNLLLTLLDIDKKNQYKLFYNSFLKSDQRLHAFERDNVEIIKSNHSNKVFNYGLQKTLAYPKIDKLMKGLDIYFAPHFNFISLSKEAKFVLTIHDVSFLRYPEFFSFRQNFWHRSLAIKKLLKRADVVVAVSENTKQDLIELLNVPEEKIKVIYSGLNQAKTKYFSQEKRDKYFKEQGIKSGYILYLGNIEPRKNINTLISSYNLLRQENEDLKNTQLILAGAPAWKIKKAMLNWKKSPYKEDIILTGYVSEEEKEYLYSGAKVFAYPSFYEGFGFPPLEAMSHSVPVVASNVSSLPEITGKAAILVDPYRREEIVEALAIAIQDKAMREKMITLAQEQIEKFNWESSARAYLKLFESFN